MWSLLSLPLVAVPVQPQLDKAYGAQRAFCCPQSRLFERTDANRQLWFESHGEVSMSCAACAEKNTGTHRILASFGTCLILSLSCAIVARAQVTTADILGAVSDSSGAVLPKVTVVVTNTGTHDTRTTQS